MVSSLAFATACIQDTLIEQNTNADSIITQFVEEKRLPQKEKASIINQFTKYGFRDLFTQFDYNSTLPYSNQINPNAEWYMQDYLKHHSKHLLQMKKWATPYFDLIENILSQYGLPSELKYLAVIESSLNTRATSWVGAAGPWQFMPASARDFGLVVSRVRDDRRDYFKSTHAAARMLLKLYTQYHDWLLVIAAYNGGAGRVNDAILKSGSRNFWKLQYNLPEESRKHVKKFIATHYVMETNSNGTFASDLNKENKPSSKQLSSILNKDTTSVIITGKYNATIISKHLQMPKAMFDDYNPEFDQRISHEGQYPLCLPIEKMEIFKTIKYKILSDCVSFLLGNNEAVEVKTYPPPPSQKKSKKRTEKK